MTAVRSRPALVTVVIPTHSHANTIGLAIDSVLAQTIGDLEVVVIGDGATAPVVDALRHCARDERIRTLFRPKSVSRAEEARHEILLASQSTFVAYLGDDDLMLPDHLEQMIDLLADADFAHPLPMSVDREGGLFWHATDLSREDCRQWHLHPRRNAVSLSGVTHRLAAYRRLPFGWRPAPAGSWSDHYMWQQWFAVPGMRYRTGTRTTILKLDASWRGDMSDELRRTELLDWQRRSMRPEFAGELARLSTDAMREFGIRTRLMTTKAQDKQASTSLVAARVPELNSVIDALRIEIHGLEIEAGRLRNQLELARHQRDVARMKCDLITATRTWRAREWVRGLRPVRAIQRMRRAVAALRSARR